MAIFESGGEAAALYTSRANLVGVITNGTAVLGLGNIGPLTAKPVMQGKCCLFKKFAVIDVFDIELAETDPDKLVDIIAALEPTFGGIKRSLNKKAIRLWMAFLSLILEKDCFC
jgi:malate dehydrogenase (oxaloacetate-decarboxylating)(NADP+)